MFNIFKVLLIIFAALLAQACTVQYSQTDPIANNPRYKNQDSRLGRISRARAQSPQLVINGVKQPSYGAQNASNRPKSQAIDPNSPKALTFGEKRSTADLALVKNIPGRGGIKWGGVVVLPSKTDWIKMVARSRTGKATLHVKTIRNGEAIAQTYKRRSEATMPLRNGTIPEGTMFLSQDHGVCKLVLDDTGEPVAIRENETGFNRYGFYHFINHDHGKHYAQEKVVKAARTAFEKQKSKLSSLKRSIAKNRANRNGLCVSVAQRPIPKAPKRIDPKRIALNAHGACVNLIGSRSSHEQVVNALESGGRWDISQNYAKWVLSGNKMSCAAGVTISEFDTTITNMVDIIFGKAGKDYHKKAMRKDINSCIYAVESACDDGYSAWVRNRARIINEPKQLKNQCESDKRKLATYDYSAYNLAKKRLDKAEKLLKALSQKKGTVNKEFIVPFTDKRTYCKI